MSIATKILHLTILLGLASVVTGCSGKKESKEVEDMNALRAELREQVDRGTLTREEAIVKLARAQVKYGSKRKKQDRELSPALKAYGEELKGKVTRGDMTADEAKDAWFEALGKSKSGAGTQEGQDATGETR